METVKYFELEYEGHDIHFSLALNRDGEDGLDSVRASWWVVLSDVEAFYFSQIYDFNSFVEASRFVSDFSTETAQILIDSYTSI